MERVEELNKIVFYLFCPIIALQGFPEHAFNIPGLSALLLIPFWLIIYDTTRKFGVGIFYPSKRCVSQRFLFNLTFIFLALLVLAYMRALFTEEAFAKARIVSMTLYWITIPLYFIALRVRGISLEQGNNVFLSSIALYLAINVVLDLLGVRSPFISTLEIGQGAISGFFGLETERIALPLSYDTGGGGALVGLALLGAISGILFYNSNRIKRYCWSLLLLCGWAIFRTDSRGAVFFSLVASTIIICIPLKRLGILKWSLLVPPLLLLALWLSPESLITLLMPDSSSLARGDLSLVTGREHIWNSVIEKLDTFDPKLTIGYGLNGQVSSGVSEGYLDMFIDKTSESEALLMQTHSNFYQLILDMGYLGALVYLLIFYVLFRVHAKRAALIRKKTFNGVMTLAGMLYILLIGLTSVTLYYTNTMLIFSWFLMVLMLTVVELPGRLKGNRRYQLAARASVLMAGLTSGPASVPGLAGLDGAGSPGVMK